MPDRFCRRHFAFRDKLGEDWAHGMVIVELFETSVAEQKQVRVPNTDPGQATVLNRNSEESAASAPKSLVSVCGDSKSAISGIQCILQAFGEPPSAGSNGLTKMVNGKTC